MWWFPEHFHNNWYYYHYEKIDKYLCVDRPSVQRRLESLVNMVPVMVPHSGRWSRRWKLHSTANTHARSVARWEKKSPEFWENIVCIEKLVKSTLKNLFMPSSGSHEA